MSVVRLFGSVGKLGSSCFQWPSRPLDDCPTLTKALIRLGQHSNLDRLGLLVPSSSLQRSQGKGSRSLIATRRIKIVNLEYSSMTRPPSNLISKLTQSSQVLLTLTDLTTS